jgi:hypothetical protein
MQLGKCLGLGKLAGIFRAVIPPGLAGYVSLSYD